MRFRPLGQTVVQTTVHAVGACAVLILLAQPALAQSLPGPADAGRVDPMPQLMEPKAASEPPVKPTFGPTITTPEGAENVTFQLKTIDLGAVTAFKPQELSNIYEPYIGQTITLDIVWQIAGQITERYRQQGYFLSRAYVPAQSIEDGHVRINVVEGYISTVELNDPIGETSLVKTLIGRLTRHNPIDTHTLESFMLRLNDIPGVNFQALIAPSNQPEDASVKLSLVPVEEDARAAIQFDNFGSRFLGPYQSSVHYQRSIIPYQMTTFSALTSILPDELAYAALRHDIPVHPDWNIHLSGNYVTAEPGASLDPNDITSDSFELGVGITYQAVRQRLENLSFSLAFEGKNTDSDILGNTILTRDRIRAGRFRVAYDTNDGWEGYNYLSATVNQGLKLLGSSDPDDANLSRAEAEPDFTTVAFRYTRQQSLPGKWLIIGHVAGQIASDPLFSAEEFGIGGQSFGRAYDPSEITGDHGLAGSVELRYHAFAAFDDMSLSPYFFYDIGKVWNEDSSDGDISATSSGVGVRVSHPTGINANLGLAFPLTKAVQTPIYGSNHDPRLLLQVGYDF